MSVSTLNDIRQQLGRYGIPILHTLGNVGNLFTVIILGRTLKQRANSCALYLFFAAIANWLVIDTALVSNLYGIDHIEPIHTSDLLCKLRWYGGHVLFIASRNFMIAACVDRWALCSQNIKIRSICQAKIAYRVTICIIISSVLMHIPLFFFFDNNSGRCIINHSFNFTYTIYSLIFIGILPPLLMILFTFLARYNLTKRVRFFSDTGQDIPIHKRDHDLMKMLIGEVFIFCVTTCPFPSSTLYHFLTASIAEYKSPLRVAIESLIGFIIQPLLSYVYCCKQFYVYAVFSRKFREDFYDLFRQRNHRHGVRFTTKLIIDRVGRN